MEARATGVTLNSAHAGVVDGVATRKLLQQSQSQLGTVSQLLAGGVAGAVAKTCTAPLARLTILFQVQGMHSDVAILSKISLWKEASRIVNEEGFRAFWKGNMVTIIHRLPYSAVNFYAYEHFKKLLHSFPGLKNDGVYAGKSVALHFVSGGLAGITSAGATYPLDLVRTRLAAQGVGPSLAISFSVYEALRSYWQCQRPNDSTLTASLACGSLSGMASSTVTFPLDLVRRRMQLEGAGGQARVYSTGILGTFGHIFRTEGLRGLYRGILPEYYKVVPGVGIAFMTYETLKMLLSPR
ncbi:hypothetical protein V2J09_010496 [Rumex salicifolius]